MIKQKVTMDDIARRTGLSKMTVSRVISNRGYASDATRKRVLAAATRLDYQVNLLASQFSRARTGLLGLIVPFEGVVGSYYFGQILQGIQQAIGRTDHHMVLYDSLAENFNDGQKCANLCRQKRVDGLIVIAPHRDDRFVRTFAHLRFPIVVVGSSVQGGRISYVDADNEGGSAMATRHLIDLGHRRIAFLKGPASLRDALQRESAFRDTLARRRVSVPEGWIASGDFDTRKAFHATRELLDTRERPTAIFASNDLMAFGAIDAARSLGLRVPEDLSVIGFDDEEAASEMVPPLTTVRQPMRDLGRVAAEHLLEEIRSEGEQRSLHRKLPTELVVRATTAPPATKR